MTGSPNQSDKQSSLSDKWLIAFKNHPVIAFLIVVGTVGLGFLKWTNETIDEGTKVSEKLGYSVAPDVASQRRQVNKSAYQLGRTVAWMSFFARNANIVSNDDDLRNRASNSRTELRALLKVLALEVDDGQQDFISRSPLDDYEHSDGARFLRGIVNSKHGELAANSFQLGLQIQSYIFVAQERKFRYSIMSDSGIPAMETVEGLQSDAKKIFNITGRKVNILAHDSDDIDGINNSVNELLTALDSEIDHSP